MPIDEHAIPYGTIQIGDIPDIIDDTTPQPIWIQLADIDQLRPFATTTEDRRLLESIAVVLDSGLIQIQAASNQPVALIRLYFLPSNLPSVRAARTSGLDTSKLSRLSRHVSAMLKCTSTDPELWNGNISVLQDLAYPEDRPGPVTLRELYDSLPSPTIDFTRCSPNTVSLVQRVLVSGVDGCKTRLFRYQRETVAKMIQRELHPGSDVDPLYLPLRDIRTGLAFYLQPSTLEVVRDPPLMAQCHGGILSEELGSGKTLMLLGLILSSKDQLAQPEESAEEARPVLTPLSLRIFQTSDVLDMIDRHYPEAHHHREGGPATLVEMLVHQLRCHSDQAIVRSIIKDPHCPTLIRDALEQNVAFYFHGAPPVGRAGKEIGPRKVLLTSATLLLLPTHLLIQWRTEIHKHCEDDSLRIIVIDSKDRIPPAAKLATDYDLVIMTHPRFAAEEKKSNLQELHSAELCQCSTMGEIRVPKCNCVVPDKISPLLLIRWKRLVIDEGHIVAQTTTNLSTLTKVLSVERRWMVSGTPTTNLLGLGLGRSSAVKDEAFEHQPQESQDANLMDEVEPVGASWVWPAQDRNDLHKLERIITEFLQTPQFASQPQLFKSNVSAPLFRRDGPAFGSTNIIKQVMSQVMVRHSVDDIEKEISFPPLEKTSVLLDMDPMAVISYNMIQCQFVINAIDSERKDQDYFFHPSNAAALKQVTEGLSQAMFWQADPKHFRVDETLKNARGSLLRAKDGKINVSEGDFQLLEEIIGRLERIASNALWRAIQTREEIPYLMQGVPENLQETWSRLPSDLQCRDDESRALLHADRVVKLRQAVVHRQLGRSGDTLADLGRKLGEEDLAKEEALIKAQRRKKKSRRSDNRSAHLQDFAERNHLKSKQAGAAEINSNAPIIVPLSDEPPQEEASFTAGVMSCLSSKLHWILRDVLSRNDHCKYLIFSSSPLTLAHIGDGLEVLDVPYLSFTSATGRKTREQMPTTFETSDRFRVFLMELKHGARGLNLVSANRVIFCEPVWAADVESQAIKRAHRIGQTQAISVVTLAIRGTVEEEIVKHRSAQNNRLSVSRDNGRADTVMTAEPRMRSFLENPRFLPEGQSELKYLGPLLEIVYKPTIEGDSEQECGERSSKRIKLEPIEM